MAPAEQLATWCARSGEADALVGGFFVTPVGTPLGELWIGGDRVDTTRSTRPGAPCARAWRSTRTGSGWGRATRSRAPRRRPAPGRPVLASGGVVAGAAIDDREGFTAGSVQFDSDIRDGRHPRAALGIDDHRIVAVVCDGRADDESGLTLPELAALMVSLGVRDAINLDGGGSATLIAGGRMLNRPRARGTLTWWVGGRWRPPSRSARGRISAGRAPPPPRRAPPPGAPAPATRTAPAPGRGPRRRAGPARRRRRRPRPARRQRRLVVRAGTSQPDRSGEAGSGVE